MPSPRAELDRYWFVDPKARRLALGLTITAAPQLIARLTQVTLKNAVDYSSILLPFQRFRRQKPFKTAIEMTETADTSLKRGVNETAPSNPKLALESRAPR